MYTIKNLEDISYEEITACWNQAFADYVITLQMTLEGAEAYFRSVGVSHKYSFAAFSNNELVGLILNATSLKGGELIAYDAMTGIVPEHRGKGVFSLLFDATRNCLKALGISKYHLEVITTNERAIPVYQKKGGKIIRELSFLRGKVTAEVPSDVVIESSPLDPNNKVDTSFYRPAYSNRTVILLNNPTNIEVVSACRGDRRAAIVINAHGSILQVRYQSTEDFDLLYAIFAFLSNKHETLRFSNLPLTEKDLVAWLTSIGFEAAVNQYEMCIEF
jgi:GNAT superfamily N-acetyltransferase